MGRTSELLRSSKMTKEDPPRNEIGVVAASIVATIRGTGIRVLDVATSSPAQSCGPWIGGVGRTVVKAVRFDAGSSTVGSCLFRLGCNCVFV